MPHETAITLAASATQTVTGTGTAVDMGACTTAALTLIVTAATGSLTASVETSPDSATWRALGTFAAATAAGVQAKRFPGADRYVRAKWTITGATPSFTFSMLGTKVLVLATPADLDKLGCGGNALGDLSDEDKDRALCAATDDVDGALESGGYLPPWTAWRSDLRQRVVDIAVFRLMKRRGFMPQGPDEMIVKAYDDAQAWLTRVAREERACAGLVDSTPSTYDGGAFAVSRSKRGW